MIDPQQHIEKARKNLAVGRLLVANGFFDEAGRSAYMAAFHAAQAFTVSRSGKEPKTHGGLRSEFARLVKETKAVEPRHVSFLSRAYELKTFADYADNQAVLPTEALAALDAATEMLEVISSALGSSPV